MINFVIRRVLSSIPVLIGILLVTFALARLTPGDPCTALLGEHATPQVCRDFRRCRSADPDTARDAGDVARFDFGDDRYQRPVSLMLVERLP
jgi:peptide/nickel transport system permease protein